MPVEYQLLAVFVVGGALGLLVGWIVGRSRPTPVDGRLETELRQQMANRDAEMRAAQAKLEDELNAKRGVLEQAMRDLAAAQAELEAMRNAMTELREQHRHSEERITALQTELQTSTNKNVEFTSETTYLKKQLADERQAIESLNEKFRKDFEAVSNKLLVDSSSKFNQQSAESLEKLLSPLKTTLGEFKTSLDSTRTETVANNALLKDQVSRIGAEAASLAKALKGEAKVLGDWGENMLDQILEKSGLQRDIHYRRQHGARDGEGEGDQRFLDVIVDLPDKRSLIIDSKVSLRAYEECMNSADDALRDASLQRHVDALRKHFKDLGGKRYHDLYGINAPDFVLMYIPIEGAFVTAMAKESRLFSEALDHNVVLITNSTLLATLRTVTHVWRLAEQQKNAQNIAQRAGKLYDKFVGFVTDLQNVGNSLSKAQNSWDEAFKKLSSGKGNLIGRTEDLKRLGANTSKSLPSELIDTDEDADTVSLLPTGVLADPKN